MSLWVVMASRPMLGTENRKARVWVPVESNCDPELDMSGLPPVPPMPLLVTLVTFLRVPSPNTVTLES